MKPKFLLRAAGLAAFVYLSGVASAQPDWTHKSPAHVPPKRVSPAISQFSNGASVVMFGGLNLGPAGVFNQFNVLGDTWIWNGTDWSQVTAFFGATPPARFGATMAYDPFKSQVVMFGGVDANGNVLGDTWLFGIQRICLSLNCTTLGEWQQLSFAPGASPPARRDASLAFDPSSGILLTNGFNGTAFLQDTWVFSTSSFTWAKLSPLGSPNPGRSKTPMAQCTSSTLNFAMFFGGIGATGVALGDAWTFSPVEGVGNVWGGTVPSPGPRARFGHGMAYYPVSGKDVLYGGNTGFIEGIGQLLLGDTWNGGCNSGTGWSQATPLHSPGTRFLHGMTTGPNDLTLVMFGGSNLPPGALFPNGRDLNDTWTWGRRVACLPVDGSELSVGTEVTCQFDPTEGSLFAGWNASGFGPPFTDALTTTFHTESPGPAAITAQWTDETGAHITTLNYTVKRPTH
jgi:hypothetical protein